MKTFYQLLMLFLAVTFSSATPDWNAIKAKYEEVEAKWRDHAEKVLEIIKDEVDAEDLEKAEETLYAFLEKGKAYYESTVYKKIEEKSLTAQQAEEIRDTINELSSESNGDFMRFKAKLKQETQQQLEDLYNDSQNYRFIKVKEIVQILNS